MSETMGLLELAERCEIVSGPDRVLDGEICLALGLAGGNVRVDQRTGWVVGGNTPLPANPLEYTSSIDAAMTLIPDGWAVEALTVWPASPDHVNTPSPAHSRVALIGTSTERWRSGLVWGHGGKDGRSEAQASTPARAIIAASLRALSKGSDV